MNNAHPCLSANAGLITATTALHAGVGGTVFQANVNAVGIGTSTQRSLLDVDGRVRTKSHHESVGVETSTSGVVTIDLAEANSFTVTIQEAITQFTLKNPPADASSFTLAISQDSTGGYAVGIDTFKDSGGSAIPVYWSGSVVPIVTTTASKLIFTPLLHLMVVLHFMAYLQDRTSDESHSISSKDLYFG